MKKSRYTEEQIAFALKQANTRATSALRITSFSGVGASGKPGAVQT